MLSQILAPPQLELDLMHHDKRPQDHLYLAQPYTVQIIQLVECPPPPPRSAIDPSDDSCSSDDDDSVCSSYCSSDPQVGSPIRCTLSPTDTSSIRMKRILAWREDFFSHMSTAVSDVSSSPLKRKMRLPDDDDDDVASQSSKRSRSQDSQGDQSESSLGEHSCPACDATFSTRQSLRMHGRDARANEACSVAVNYAFE